jgi:hypothetical protein
MGKGGRFCGCLFVCGPSNGVEQTTTNAGILHFVQDDDFEGGRRFGEKRRGRATAKTYDGERATVWNKQRHGTSNEMEQATTNTGILHFVQDDDFEG